MVNLREYQQNFEKDERKYRSDIVKYFTEQIKPLLSRINQTNTPYALVDEVPAYIQQGDLQDIYIRNYTSLGAKYYEAVMDDLLKKSPYSLTQKELDPNDPFFVQMTEFVTTQLASRVISVVNTSQKVARKHIADVISVAGEEGWSIPQIKKEINRAIKAEWRIMTKFRSAAIARTETLTLTNRASYMGAVNTGLEVRKKWLSFIDNRTRETHIQSNGQTVPLKDYFQVGSSLMLHPGDSGGSAKEVVNCRCTLSYVVS